MGRSRDSLEFRVVVFRVPIGTHFGAMFLFDPSGIAPTSDTTVDDAFALHFDSMYKQPVRLSSVTVC